MSTSGGLVSNILTFVGTVATLGIFFAGGALFFTVYEGDIWTTRTVNSQILCLDWTFFDAFYFWDVPNQTIDFHVNFLFGSITFSAIMWLVKCLVSFITSTTIGFGDMTPAIAGEGRN